MLIVFDPQFLHTCDLPPPPNHHHSSFFSKTCKSVFDLVIKSSGRVFEGVFVPQTAFFFYLIFKQRSSLLS